jgi:hypothetical protein
MPISSKTLEEYDEAYMHMLDSIRAFFRYSKRHPDVEAGLNEMFQEEYYERVAQTVHNSVNHELKYRTAASIN